MKSGEKAVYIGASEVISSPPSTTADDTHLSKENVRNIDDGLRSA